MCSHSLGDFSNNPVLTGCPAGPQSPSDPLRPWIPGTPYRDEKVNTESIQIYLDNINSLNCTSALKT